MGHNLSETEKQAVASNLKDILGNLGNSVTSEGARKLVEHFEDYIRAAEKVAAEGGFAKADRKSVV